MSEGGAYKTRRTKRPGLFSPAARTSKSFRPAQPKQIIPTSLLVVETRLELLDNSRIILVHGLKSGRGYYILWLLASSKYPILSISAIDSRSSLLIKIQGAITLLPVYSFRISINVEESIQ